MDVSSTSQAQSGNAAAPAASSQSNAVLTSDFEVFLQMLTTQARYQDPLEPIDSSEYAAQLAQFSMVEQQVATNTLMEQLVAALNTSEAGNLVDWIGMDALTTQPAYFDGNPMTVVPNPPVGAEEMYLVVTDELGTRVQTQQIGVSSDPVIWRGEVGNQSLPNGRYTFEIESRAAGEVLQLEPAPVYGRVVETRLDQGQMRLILAGGASVPSSGILGLRAPQS